jgi:hypothetical protein
MPLANLAKDNLGSADGQVCLTAASQTPPCGLL